uniref:Cation-transporting ATPase n=1 Tax=Plectus sambesii TaxID=2011161 RepID=A0A914V030_9BILA
MPPRTRAEYLGTRGLLAPPSSSHLSTRQTLNTASPATLTEKYTAVTDSGQNDRWACHCAVAPLQLQARKSESLEGTSSTELGEGWERATSTMRLVDHLLERVGRAAACLCRILLPVSFTTVKIRSQRSTRVAQTRAERSPLLSPAPSASVADVDDAISPSESMDGHTVVLRISDDAKIQIWGFRTNLLKTTLSVIGYILTLGFFRLLLHWQPKWHVSCTKDRCHLSEADTILVCDEHHIWTLRSMRVAEPGVGEQISLPCAGGDFLDVSELRFFTYRKLKYVWHPRVKKFTSVHSLDHEVPISRYHDWARSGEGLTDAEFARRLFVYGRNLIEVKLKPILVLLFKEAITPFYVFQVFSVTVWYNDNYVYYASVIVLMSVMSITVDVYQIRSQEKNLRDMVHSTDVIDVVRSGKVVALSSDQLVPGDLVHIPPHGCTLQCDAVLLNGTCIVNESMLTGESVPVTKVALPETDLTEEVDGAGPIYTNTEHAKHTLYCGTQVLQTRFYSGQPVQAIVIRTGYATLKGQLVRSIMYPKPVDFRFTKDLFKFVGVLAVIAAMGLAYSITVMIVNGSDVKKVILRSLDIITIVVPPALPAAMTIGIFAAQMRLKKRKIYCISPSTINTCGG